MSRKIVVTLATKDVPKARAFYTALGFPLNEKFCGETSAYIVMSDAIHVMLLEESAFSRFSPRGICDTSQFLEVLHSLTCHSRAEVDEIIQKALAAGGSVFEE